MKAYKTLLFIISVFLMMAILGYAIPTEGIDIGQVNITFPTVEDMMKNNEEDDGQDKIGDALLDAESIRAYIEEQQMTEEKRIRFEAIKAKNSISFPNDSIEWMDDVFAALEGAEENPVRIIHYGDSQIEEDRMSSDLRASFQREFGGYGVGMVPAVQSIPTTAIGQNCSAELQKYLVYGSQNMKLGSKKYGVLGQTVALNGEAEFSFYRLNLRGTKSETKKFGNLTIILNDTIGNGIEATAIYGDNKKTQKAINGEHYIKFILPDSTTRLTVKMKGTAMIDAFILDGNENGVQFDNAAMRGCSGTIFTSIASKSLKLYYDKFNVPLIIMQFGGNSMPYSTTEKAINNYCSAIARQIRYLNKTAPNSKILFIGPSDMATNINGTKQTYPHLPLFVEELKKTCNENNAAYWDLYKAMGGKNSMSKWVNSNPPLAGSDHIHFTQKGAEKASSMLYDAIMTAYGYYKYRKEK